jgi:hypothetical protein
LLQGGALARNCLSFFHVVPETGRERAIAKASDVVF